MEALCVYKPVAGERPLWDFPHGTLAGREYAAYLVSEATGWNLVPPTVLRDGPYGEGMVQFWVDVDESVEVERMVRSADPRLRPMATLDAVLNNSDRKGVHLLPTVDGDVYGCDHGLTFHEDDKLRTVLWAWRGEPLADDEREVVDLLADPAGRRRRAAGVAGAVPDAGGADGDGAAGPDAAQHRSVPRAQRRLARCALAAVLSLLRKAASQRARGERRLRMRSVFGAETGRFFTGPA